MHYCDVISRFSLSSLSVTKGSSFAEPDEHALAWEALYVPSASDERDPNLLHLMKGIPNKAPTEVALSSPEEEQGELHSIPATPPGDHDQGDVSPENPRHCSSC